MGTKPNPLLQFPLLFLLYCFITCFAAISLAAGGSWELLTPSTGVSAMHMQLLHNDRVIIFDRTDFGASNISLSKGRCRNDPNELVLKTDCSAHSVEYDISTGSVRPLMVLTDTWCSSGTVDRSGRLIQTGGYNDGDRTARIMAPTGDSDWVETPNALTARRWYATNQILPDGRAFIIGGRRQFNYEFYPKDESVSANSRGTILMRLLVETHDIEENNLYPFVHMNVDGNLFIFANNRSILFNYKIDTVVRTYPIMPGGPRNYPSCGSSVLLPLNGLGTEAEVMVCGGAPAGSFLEASRNKKFNPALNTCGRIRITDPNPSWVIETMPTPRVMGDMVLLPSGEEVLIINGAAKGTAGWEYAQQPVLNPLVYSINGPVGKRFTVQNPGSRPRMYHSTAILLRDGRVLVGGSNPHIYYNFTGVEYPTDLSLEAFSPNYLGPENANSRPRIITTSPIELRYGTRFKLRFVLQQRPSARGVWVTMVSPSFTTHAFSMNQRLLRLDGDPAAAIGSLTYEVAAVAPKSNVMAPPGYYMAFVVNGRIPSYGIWVHIE